MVSRYKRIGKSGQLEHRYVMEQFLGRKLERTEQVHHINGNRFDNRIENLVVLTAAEHMRIHKQKYPRVKTCVVCGKQFEPYPSKRKSAKVCSQECKRELAKINATKRKRPIKQLTKDGALVRLWDSARDVQNETGYFESNIAKCCTGKIRSYKGYVWRYA